PVHTQSVIAADGPSSLIDAARPNNPLTSSTVSSSQASAAAGSAGGAESGGGAAAVVVAASVGSAPVEVPLPESSSQPATRPATSPHTASVRPSRAVAVNMLTCLHSPRRPTAARHRAGG